LKIYINTPQFEGLKKKLEEILRPLFGIIDWTSSPIESDINIYDQNSWQQALASEKNILLSKEEDEFNIINLLETRPCHHLIGFSIDFINEIQTTIQIIMSSEVWKIKENFGELEQKYSLNFKNSGEIKTKLKSLLDKINFEDQLNSSFNIVYLLSNELLMNAFFHQKNVKTERTENIELENAVEFVIGINTRGILFKVKDTNGGFPLTQIINSLSRGFKEKAPRAKTTTEAGAGLGLYFTYKMSNQLILNNTEGVGSEVVCVIENAKRYIQYKQRVSSLHYFTRT
jgi:hypothetical protein